MSVHGEMDSVSFANQSPKLTGEPAGLISTDLHHIPIIDLLTQHEIGQLIYLRRETVNRLLRA